MKESWKAMLTRVKTAEKRDKKQSFRKCDVLGTIQAHFESLVKRLF